MHSTFFVIYENPVTSSYTFKEEELPEQMMYGRGYDYWGESDLESEVEDCLSGYYAEFFKPEMTVKLIKEPDNEYDKEAIKVELEGLGQVGYVANSPYTVQGESYSAGRLYDKIGDTAEGTVMYVLPKGVLCSIEASPDRI